MPGCRWTPPCLARCRTLWGAGWHTGSCQFSQIHAAVTRRAIALARGDRRGRCRRLQQSVHRATLGRRRRRQAARVGSSGLLSREAALMLRLRLAAASMRGDGSSATDGLPGSGSERCRTWLTSTPGVMACGSSRKVSGRRRRRMMIVVLLCAPNAPSRRPALPSYRHGTAGAGKVWPRRGAGCGR